MAALPEIEQLVARRRLLLEESERLRQELSGHVDELRMVASWAERGYAVTQMLLPFWPVGATGAGLLLTRRKGGWLRRIGKVWSWWRLSRNLLSVWRGLSGRGPSAQRG